MSNDEHVARLGRGAAVWNEWRAKLDETPDLSQVVLRGLDLSGFDLLQADLRGGDLGEQRSPMQICQVPISRARTSSKLYSMALTLPGILDRSPISELRPACGHPELAVGLP
jgi:hypothetical protein